MYHVIEYLITPSLRVLGVGDRIIVGGGLQHTHQYCCLFGLQFSRGGVEIGLTCRLDTEGIRTEIHCVGIHGEDLFLFEEILQFTGDDPFLGLHDEHLHTRDLSEQTGRILRTYTEHILGQLLGDGRTTTGIMMKHRIFNGT